MPTAKNRFQILNLHPKKIYLKNKTKKKHGLKEKNLPKLILILKKEYLAYYSDNSLVPWGYKLLNGE